jgi:hypothetical protein
MGESELDEVVRSEQVFTGQDHTVSIRSEREEVQA